MHSRTAWGPRLVAEGCNKWGGVGGKYKPRRGEGGVGGLNISREGGQGEVGGGQIGTVK